MKQAPSKTVDRALDILNIFVENNEGFSLNEISDFKPVILKNPIFSRYWIDFVDGYFTSICFPKFLKCVTLAANIERTTGWIEIHFSSNDNSNFLFLELSIFLIKFSIFLK